MQIQRNLLSLPRSFVGGAIVAICSLSSGTAHAQILTDGGFDNTAQAAPTNGFSTYNAGSTGLTGWSIVTGSIDLINSGYWQAANGNQSIDLDGNTPGTISQSFTTTIGTSYSVAFAYGNNPGGSSASLLMTIVDSGSTPKTLESAGVSHSGSTSGAMNYSSFTGSFVADTTLTTIQFASTDSAGSDAGIALDAVGITGSASAPEPTPIYLAACGLVPMGLIARLRKRN